MLLLYVLISGLPKGMSNRALLVALEGGLHNSAVDTATGHLGVCSELLQTPKCPVAVSAEQRNGAFG